MQALQGTIHKFPTTIICGTQEFVTHSNDNIM